MIEINLRKLSRGTHTGRVRVTRSGKTFWREQRIGRKVNDNIKKTPTMEPLGMENRLSQYFGSEIVADYSKEISGMSEEELQDEYNSLEENDENFAKNFIKQWGRSETQIDGWVSRLLGLEKETSRQGPDDWSEDWEDTQEGHEKTLMKSIMVNQEYLKRKYPSGFIDLYRAMGKGTYNDAKEKGVKLGDIFSLKSYNISSWSEYPEFAEGYAAYQGAGIVVKVKVPIENMLFSTRLVGNNLNGWSSNRWEIKDGREYAVLGGGNLNVQVQSLKEYDHRLSSEEFSDILVGIHKREGLI